MFLLLKNVLIMPKAVLAMLLECFCSDIYYDKSFTGNTFLNTSQNTIFTVKWCDRRMVPIAIGYLLNILVVTSDMHNPSSELAV